MVNSLARGGAEILLKNAINMLEEYSHIVVFLQMPDTMQKEFAPQTEFIYLEYKGWRDFPKAIRRLKNLIKKVNPVLVHSHLFEATICARLATPRKMPLLSTVHSMYSRDAFAKNKKSLWIEKLTTRNDQVLIAVSKATLDDYINYIPFKGKTYVLYNFLPDDYFLINNADNGIDQMRCVAVGNLKEAKNYPFLLKLFSQLRGQNITLDIYGEGEMRDEIQREIEEKDLPVKLCRRIPDIKQVLPQYDLFIQASSHEGFGLSVIEAMAAKLPLCLSSIDVFHEITNNFAHFFDIQDVDSCKLLIQQLAVDRNRRNMYVEKARAYCEFNYSQVSYKGKLLEIYNSMVSERASKVKSYN